MRFAGSTQSARSLPPLGEVPSLRGGGGRQALPEKRFGITASLPPQSGSSVACQLPQRREPLKRFALLLSAHLARNRSKENPPLSEWVFSIVALPGYALPQRTDQPGAPLSVGIADPGSVSAPVNRPAQCVIGCGTLPRAAPVGTSLGSCARENCRYTERCVAGALNGRLCRPYLVPKIRSPASPRPGTI